MLSKPLMSLVFASAVASAIASDSGRVLVDFTPPDAAKRWRAINDGVMGGRSDGRFRINEQQHLEFFGTLSLENNGGFASTRSRQQGLGLHQGDVLVARVRGDGREYQFNLYAGQIRGGYSYRQPFETKPGEWVEVAFPVDKFVATWRGRRFPNQTLDPTKVDGIGFLLGDKRPGPFKLEVDWIKATSERPAR